MKFMQKGTRAYYEASPQCNNICLADVPAALPAINCKNYLSTVGKVSPESQALQFYTLNHLVSIVRKNFTLNEPLPDWADRAYSQYLGCLESQGHRMFYYLLLIVTREARHVKNTDLTFWAEFGDLHSPMCRDFHEAIVGKDRQGTVDWFFAHTPKVDLEVYLSGVVHLFNKGNFNGGFGGKPWGRIAQTILSFVVGDTSMETMIDTAYTLAHNNGPVFNKDMMYSMYSDLIYLILDVQRSGQIPELYLDSGHIHHSFISPAVALTVSEFRKNVPDEFRGYVDWFQVEAMGSLKKYPSNKSNQVVLHGDPKKSQDSSVHVPPTYVHPPTGTNPWPVFPGQTLTIYNR